MYLAYDFEAENSDFRLYLNGPEHEELLKYGSNYRIRHYFI
jgi:hypothetical protein